MRGKGETRGEEMREKGDESDVGEGVWREGWGWGGEGETRGRREKKREMRGKWRDEKEERGKRG